MSLEVSLKIREYVDGTERSEVSDDFLRRDFTLPFKGKVSLASGTPTDIATPLSTVEFVYANVTGDAATITISKDNEPMSFTFNDTFLAFVMSASKITLQSDADTEVTFYFAGS